MQCPVCHFENPPGAKFCQECGHSLQQTNFTSQSTGAAICPRCQSPIPYGLPFCPGCGQPVNSAPAGQSPAPQHAHQTGRITEVTSIVTDVDKSILCPECGQEVSALETRCPQCGADLYPVSASVQVPDLGTAMPEGGYGSEQPGLVPGYTQLAGQYQGMPDQQPPKKRRKKQKSEPDYSFMNQTSGRYMQPGMTGGSQTSFTGRQDTLVCPRCGAMNEPDASFCMRCGQNLNTQTRQPSAQRGNLTSWNQPVTQNSYGTAGPVTNSTMTYGQSSWDESGSFQSMGQRRSLGLILAPVISGAIMLASLGAGCLMMNTAHSSRRTAQTFITNLCNAEYRQAYQMMEVEDSPFLTVEAFGRLNRQMQLEDTSAIHLQLESETSAGSGSTVIANTVYEAVLDQENGLAEKSQEIIVEKTGRRHFLFFEDWKISDANLAAHQVRVLAPHGAEITIDGKAVSDKWLESEGDDQIMDTYVIPALFKTDYTFVMQAENLEKTEAVLSITEDQQVIELNPESFTAETAISLRAQAIRDLGVLYTTALNHGPYAEVSGLFADSGDQTREAYDALVEELAEGTARVSRLNLSSITARSTEGSSQISLQFDYDATLVMAANPQRTLQASGSKAAVFGYVREKGNWLMASFPDLSLGL